MTTIISVVYLHAVQTATDWLCRHAGYRVDGLTVHKQVHHIESQMEYYWEFHSKNAQNIKALMCPLYLGYGSL